jgi:hypothetical protein
MVEYPSRLCQPHEPGAVGQGWMAKGMRVRMRYGNYNSLRLNRNNAPRKTKVCAGQEEDLRDSSFSAARCTGRPAPKKSSKKELV